MCKGLTVTLGFSGKSDIFVEIRKGLTNVQVCSMSLLDCFVYTCLVNYFSQAPQSAQAEQVTSRTAQRANSVAAT
jgi:hypothetical protein